MGAAKFAVLAVLCVVLQASAEPTTEEPTCLPGFESDMVIFKVNRKHLDRGRRLGKVRFTDCTEGTGYLVHCPDSRFTIQRDGTLSVKRQVVLHDGHVDISVHFTNLRGQKMSVTVRIVRDGNHNGQHHGQHHRHHDGQHQGQHHGDHDGQHQGQHHGHHDGQHQGQHHGDHDGQHQGQHHGHHDGQHQGQHHGHHDGQHQGQHHGHHDGQHQGHHDEQHHGQHQGHHDEQHHGQHHRQHHDGHHEQHKNQHEDSTQHPKMDSAVQTETATEAPVPVVIFPKASKGLSRRKRDWVIPEISVSENDRRDYPLKISQIRSNEDKIKKIYYSITGPGADAAPVGLFTMDRVSGNLFLTQPLDREKQDKYKFQAHAVAEGAGTAEEPMEIVVNVLDQNDNKPIFIKSTFNGEVPESSPKDYEIMKVEATDADQPNTDNSDIRYRILSQNPPLPADNLFAINSHTGAIRINNPVLDREKHRTYTLKVQVADMMGEGLTGEAIVILTVSDSNDNAPVFTEPSYVASVAENKAGAQILKMSVTDGDERNSAAWNAKFTIVGGDPDGLFSVKTGPIKQEGILSTAKGLDFEKTATHTVLIAVENEVPFAQVTMTTSTATVVVTVIDVNEPPIFDPVKKTVSKKENLPVDSDVVQYTASDPDTARKQKVSYRIISDPAGWLDVNKDTGLIKVKSELDRESPFVDKEFKYEALIGAIDNDEVPATGTGTLLIQLEDVNDNAPTIVERFFTVCNKKTAPQLLSVMDKDGPGFAAPYSVSLQGMSRTNWTARMNETKTGIVLNLGTELTPGDYTVVLRIADNQGMEQDSTIQAKVCDCSGEEVTCVDRMAAGVGLPVILGILAGILLLLMLVLLLLLFARRRKGEKKEPLLQDDDVRDNIYYYDEEGGGEDDQDYDLGILHRGLDNKPDVFRNDVMPVYVPTHEYMPRPANPEDIGDFIDNNLKAADNDPTAPPYDSLLVFDYEGGGSDAGSLSSLNSSSSGDQDYNCLNEWGPRFKKLADMYGGGEDDDML